MVQQFRNHFFFAILLFGGSLWAQQASSNETEAATINHVKNLQVSSLDGNLPRVTLEFFLKYEGEGAPIKWSMTNCDQLTGKPVTDHQRVTTVCVEAEIELKDHRSATVVVSLGKPRARIAIAPSLLSVTVTDQSGSSHELRRLGELPMELHRPIPIPKMPRDLPSPAADA